MPDTDSPLVTVSAGALTGMATDTTLFPLETMKTRLQSGVGFQASGGFRRLYAGLPAAFVGSAPAAAAFFCSYELIKYGGSHTALRDAPVLHASAAAIGELCQCGVRAPAELLYQRAQMSKINVSTHLRATLASEGVRGLYRGYWSTVSRDLPFSVLQLPVWELLKEAWGGGQEVEPWQSAVCGFASGAFAGLLTTPMDVAQTRIILAARGSTTARAGVGGLMRELARTGGLRTLFSGMVPRTIWFSLWGCSFLGGYDFVRGALCKIGKE